jgi:polysaccharide export outer membrane protein
MYRLAFGLAGLVVAAFPCVVPAQSNPVPDSMPPAQTPLRAGDIIRLKIWREPDLSGDFVVTETGDAVLPKIGAMAVTRVSSDSVIRFLRASYETYLRNPTIDVTVLRRVTISGAVRTPGLYPVDQTMSIADALALAGGPTPDGRRDRVYLDRGGKRLKIDLTSQSRANHVPLTSGDQLTVPLRSWVARNTAIVVSGTLGLAGLVVALVTR